MRFLLLASLFVLHGRPGACFVCPTPGLRRPLARFAAQEDTAPSLDEIRDTLDAGQSKALERAEKARPGPLEGLRIAVTERTKGKRVTDDDKGELDSLISKAKDPLRILKDLFDRVTVDGPNKKETLEYATYPPHPQYPDRSLEKMPKMVSGRPPSNPYMWSGDKFQLLIRRLLQVVGALPGYFVRKLLRGRLRAFYNRWIGLPQPKFVIKHWEDDREVARQALAGLNPLQIERVKSKKRVRSVALNLAKKFRAKIELLLPKGDLYILDYKELVPFASPNLPPGDPIQRFFYPAVALLAPDANGELEVIGIQLERDDNAKVYTPEDPEHLWTYAKMCVANADGCVHEWLSHLGKTHLTVEPHIVAVHNTLMKDRHVLYDFLKPFLHDTLLLNWAARQTLVAYTPDDAVGSTAVADTLSSVGCANALAMIQNWWETYDFMTSGFDDDLRRRGFNPDGDALAGYLYLEDGAKIYKLLGDYATSFVNAVYESDENLQQDSIVQDWAAETSSPSRAAVHGFPSSITSREQLSKILQILMWTASGLHAAVNFPQYDFYSYVPNHPFELRESVGQVSSVESIFDKALSPQGNVFTVFQITVLLTLPSANTLLASKDLPGEYAEVSKEFRTKALELQKEMNKLNKKRTVNYPYLLPKNVPYSIDI